MGYMDSFSISINIGKEDAEILEVQWYVQEENQIIIPEEKSIAIRQSFQLTGIDEKELTLQTVVKANGKILDSSSIPLKLLPRHYNRLMLYHLQPRSSKLLQPV